MNVELNYRYRYQNVDIYDKKKKQMIGCCVVILINFGLLNSKYNYTSNRKNNFYKFIIYNISYIY